MVCLVVVIGVVMLIWGSDFMGLKGIVGIEGDVGRKLGVFYSGFW